MVEIYQIKAWIRKISPIIYRRILLPDTFSLADLHHTLQITFGWPDTYLHQFKIHGKRYGISKPGGMWFSDSPKEVQLKSFGFRLKERFLYEYNFFDQWEIEIRIEKILPIDTKKTYPICIEGRGSGPPEDCGGPWAFMKLKDKYSPWYIEARLLKMIVEDELECRSEEIGKFKYWLQADKFDRKRANRWLMQYSQGIDDWIWEIEEV